MLTPDEQKFMEYWEANRVKKKKIFNNLLIGLPAGLFIVIAIIINFLSGWYKRATMAANAEPSVFIVLLISGIVIVAFWVIFTSYHKWDLNETRYQELLSRKIEGE
jgi:uncharacterized membrane protein